MCKLKHHVCGLSTLPQCSHANAVQAVCHNNEGPQHEWAVSLYMDAVFACLSVYVGVLACMRVFMWKNLNGKFVEYMIMFLLLSAA